MIAKEEGYGFDYDSLEFLNDCLSFRKHETKVAEAYSEPSQISMMELFYESS